MRRGIIGRMQPPDMQEPSRHAWRRHAGVHLRSFGDEPLALAYDTRLARTHLIDELADRKSVV